MNIRRIVAASALAAVAAFGVAACDSSSSNDVGAKASEAVDKASDIATSATSAVESVVNQATTISDKDAQEILRTVVNPATSAADAATLVDSTDPSIGTQLHGFAMGASRGGYTPDVFTVTSVKADGSDKATADVAVKSPHAPAPVTVHYGYVKVDGKWKLSADAAQQLLSMGGGPRHH